MRTQIEGIREKTLNAILTDKQLDLLWKQRADSESRKPLRGVIENGVFRFETERTEVDKMLDELIENRINEIVKFYERH